MCVRAQFTSHARLRSDDLVRIMRTGPGVADLACRSGWVSIDASTSEETVFSEDPAAMIFVSGHSLLALSSLL